MKRMMISCARRCCCRVLAVAQPKTADDWYKEGETQYNLGNFDKAADAFKQGFDARDRTRARSRRTSTTSRRRIARPRSARTRSSSTSATSRSRMQDTSSRSRREKRPRSRTGSTSSRSARRRRKRSATSRPISTDAARIPTARHHGQRYGPRWAEAASAATRRGDDGKARPASSGNDRRRRQRRRRRPQRDLAARRSAVRRRSAPALSRCRSQATFALIAGYPIAVNDAARARARRGFTFTPVPYDDRWRMQSKSAQFIGAAGERRRDVHGRAEDRRARRSRRRRAGVRRHQRARQPVHENGASTTGALAMFAVRVGVSADYAITPNVIATVDAVRVLVQPAEGRSARRHQVDHPHRLHARHRLPDVGWPR